VSGLSWTLAGLTAVSGLAVWLLCRAAARYEPVPGWEQRPGTAFAEEIALLELEFTERTEP
jgi:hypothetical protein